MQWHMIFKTFLFEISWMLLSILLVWCFYAAFKMSKRTKGASLIYAFVPALIILINIWIVPLAIRGPSLAWLRMILSPEV